MVKIILIAVVAATSQAQSPTWTYPGAMKCLTAFTANLSAQETTIPFSNTSVGIVRARYKEQDGFFALTPKTVFFIPAAEGEKSAGETAGESKVTLQFSGESAPPPLKFFFKSDLQAGGLVHFATANEFDRKIPGQEVPPEAVEKLTNLAIAKALAHVATRVKTHTAQVRKAIETCETAQLDFRVTGAKGDDSTLRAEMLKVKNKVMPSVFSKEYWLPKKEGAG